MAEKKPEPTPTPSPSTTYTGQSKVGATQAETGKRQQQGKLEERMETVGERTEQATKGISARTGVGAAAKDEGEPARDAYPAGPGGQSTYFAALKRYRAAKEAKPTPTPTPTKKSSSMGRSMSGRRA